MSGRGGRAARFFPGMTQAGAHVPGQTLRAGPFRLLPGPVMSRLGVLVIDWQSFVQTLKGLAAGDQAGDPLR